MKLTRREFLKLTGWMGVALSSPFPLKKTPVVEAAERWLSQPEAWVPTTCLLCPGRCGLLARIVDGFVVKIEGNSEHPINQGGTCPMAQAALHMIYHPDRVPGPMKRVGKGSEGKWKRISWEEALHELAGVLKQIREEAQPHSVYFLSRGLKEEDTLRQIIDRFLQVFGSPNHLMEPAVEDGMPMAHLLSQGIQAPFAYDLERSRYILSFGASLLENWHSPCEAHRLYGYLRQGRLGPKATFVQVEPRFSVTASRCDWWLPIHPGTYGTLALGIAYVLMKENLYDKEFVEEKTVGFEDWTDEEGKFHRGLRSLIQEQYRPEYVSDVTGVPIPDVMKIAKDFARNKPSVAIADGGATLYSNGVSAGFAIHCLNALVGNIDAPGGVLVPQEIPFAELPPVILDETANQALSQARPQVAPLIKILSESSSFPVRALLLYDANPLFNSPSPQRLREAFQKIPYIVSFSPYWDESTLLADLVLPDPTFLEKWQDAPTASMGALPVVGLVQPVAKTSYEARHTGDVLLELARRLGGSVRDAFPWENFQSVVEERMKGLFEARRGTLFTTKEETTHVRLLEERGWWPPFNGSWQEFWKGFKEKGGWWDPHYSFGRRQRVYRTPSGRFEFYPKKFEGLPGGLSSLFFEKPRFEGDPNEYPFYLVPFTPLALNSPQGASSPWIQEILSVQHSIGWDSWVEINPKEARPLRIHEGDWVWLISPVGRVKVRARLCEGIHPKTVSLPFGLGHEGLGRYAKGIGVNPNDLIPERQETLNRVPVRFGVRVKLQKA